MKRNNFITSLLILFTLLLCTNAYAFKVNNKCNVPVELKVVYKRASSLPAFSRRGYLEKNSSIDLLYNFKDVPFKSVRQIIIQTSDRNRQEICTISDVNTDQVTFSQSTPTSVCKCDAK